jgi:O-antigen/teichoic acid export membrane protein
MPQSDEIRNFPANYVAQGVAFAVNAILGIAIFSKVTTLLGPELYGNYALYGVAINVVGMLALAWLSNAFLRFGREEFARTAKFTSAFGNQSFLMALTCGVLLLVVFAGRHRLANYLGLGVVSSYMVMVFLALSLASQLLAVSLKISGRFQRLALISPVQSGFFLIFLYLIGGKHGATEQVILWSLVAQGCSILFLAAFAPWSEMWPPRFDLNKIKPTLTFASASFLWMFCYQVIDSIDLIAIKAFLPIESVGIYNAAYRIMSYVWMIPQLTITLTLNLVVGFASKGRDDLVRIYATRYVRQAVLGIALVTVLVIGLSREIFWLLLKPEYHPGLVPFTMLMVTVSLRSVNAFLSPIINAYLLLKQASVLIVTMSVFNILGDWTTLKLGMGLMGPAVVTACVFLIDGCGTTWIAGRRIGLRNISHLLFAVYPILAVPIARIPEPGYRLGCLLILIVGLLVVAKRLGTFAESDMVLYERIGLPSFVKNGLLRFVKAME